MDIKSIIGIAMAGAGLYLFSKSMSASAAPVYTDTESLVTGQLPYYSDSADIWGTSPATGPAYTGEWWNFGDLSSIFDFSGQSQSSNAPIENPADWETLITDWQTSLGDSMAANWKTNEYPKYAVFISGVESKYNIQPDLLARLLYQESRYRQDVIEGVNRSPVGALGIAQFMPATASWLHVNPLDPFQAIDGAGKYLKMMYDKFHTWQYALMAYNWGPGNLSNYLQGKINIVPAETQKYVAQISADVAIG